MAVIVFNLIGLPGNADIGVIGQYVASIDFCLQFTRTLYKTLRKLPIIRK